MHIVLTSFFHPLLFDYTGSLGSAACGGRPSPACLWWPAAVHPAAGPAPVGTLRLGRDAQDLRHGAWCDRLHAQAEARVPDLQAPPRCEAAGRGLVHLLGFIHWVQPRCLMARLHQSFRAHQVIME